MSPIIVSKDINNKFIIIALEILGDNKLEEIQYRVTVGIDYMIQENIVEEGDMNDALNRFHDMQSKYFGKVLR